MTQICGGGLVIVGLSYPPPFLNSKTQYHYYQCGGALQGGVLGDGVFPCYLLTGDNSLPAMVQAGFSFHSETDS